MSDKLGWRITAHFVAFVALVMLALTFYLPGRQRAVETADLQSRLAAEAQLLSQSLASHGESCGGRGALAQQWAVHLEAQVTLIAADGVVLAQSPAVYGMGEDLSFRPEVAGALATGQGVAIDSDPISGEETTYVATLGMSDDQEPKIVRLALSLKPVIDHQNQLRLTLVAATSLAVLLAVATGIPIARHITQSVSRLLGATRRLAAGDLAARVIPTRHDELGQLMHAFNEMADRFQEHAAAMARERDEQDALLEYMADGVIIVDGAGHVQLINQAAIRLLGLDEANVTGQSLAQVVRDHHLIEVGQMCRQQGQQQETSLEIGHLGLFLRVIVTPLNERDNPRCLFILQDLTRVRHLETVRRDFVSNISHELRTPLASLKALADTLRDGALDDPPAAQRFLDRIDTEVDDMTQIVQELLELSRAESGQVPLKLVGTEVADLLAPPVERLQAQAERAGLALTIRLPPLVPLVLADAERVQQVVANLAHNAIKFTPPGGSISVSAEAAADEVIISVQDTGVGIAADDLPRIFERFYKADRARSGGGTGLGLAIARHIVQAHGGRIWAESVEGGGCAFYFTLPTADETTTGFSPEAS